MVYLKADTVSRSYGLPEKSDRTGEKVSVFSTGCFVNQPVPGAIGPVFKVVRTLSGALADIYKCSFFPQTIRDWNALSDSLISSGEGAADGFAKFTSMVRARD